MEVSLVRRRLKQAIDAAREQSQQKRLENTAGERAYQTFIETVATLVMRQLANTLKIEGYAFTVFTPGGGLRLASDRGRDDYIEFLLDLSSHPPQVMGHISHARGSRTLEEERPVKHGVGPEELSDEDVLTFLLEALQPWLAR